MQTSDQLELFSVDARRDLARALRRDGCTLAQIKAKFADESSYRIQSWVGDLPPQNPRRRVRAKDGVKARARALRGAGRTYTEIAAELGVSKSSCSLWCSDLPRPEPAPGRKRASTWGRRLAERAEERANTKRAAAASIGALSPRELFLVGVSLYWAEGGKDKPYARRESLHLINSDPSVITVYRTWLSMLGVEPDDCSYRVQIHETADVAAAEMYWSRLLGVDRSRFSQATVKRHNPKTNRLNRGAGYHGCLTVRVRQSATLYQRVEGWWEGICLGVQQMTNSEDPSAVV